MSYYLAPSLVALRSEIDARWPNRDKASDGWIGDASHSARKSDHNPDWDAGGVVRAIDVDKDGIDTDAVLKALIGDQRVWYVIFNRKIYSRTYGWKANTYTGSNPHEHHIHVSILHDKAAETDCSPWLEKTPKPKTRWTRGKRVDRIISATTREARKAKAQGRARKARVLNGAVNTLKTLARWRKK